jgi:hypothetical protein
MYPRALLVDVVAESPRDRTASRRRSLAQHRLKAVSALACMPASEAVGSVAAFRISFFQILGRMGVVTFTLGAAVRSAPAPAFRALDRFARKRAEVRRGPTPGCATLPSRGPSAVVRDAGDDLAGS